MEINGLAAQKQTQCKSGSSDTSKNPNSVFQMQMFHLCCPAVEREAASSLPPFALLVCEAQFVEKC